jgi:hypothetical protein
MAFFIQRFKMGSTGYVTFYNNYGNSSDKRFKRDIQDLSGSLNKILSLRGVSYRFIDKLGNIDFDEEKTNIGFIAQELETVFPEVVHTDEQGYKSVQYHMLNPAIIEAIKEQQELIEQQQAENQELRNMLMQILENQQRFGSDLEQCCLNHEQGDAGHSNGGSPGLDEGAAQLEQNQPNPFSENTVINYYLPNSTERATMAITDMNGVVLKTFTLSGKGYGQVLIGGGSLPSGTYIYTLTVNGERVDSKRMMLL